MFGAECELEEEVGAEEVAAAVGALDGAAAVAPLILLLD